MRDWILFLLRVNPKLDKLCEAIDAKLEKRALSLVLSVHKLCDELSVLSELKMRLVNLRVLYNSLKAALSAEEFLMLEIAAGVAPVQELQYKRTTAYRRRQKVFGKSALILAANGYDEKRLVDEFPGLRLRAA